MTETSYFWAGTATGDAQNLTNDELTDVFRKLTQTDREFLLPVVHHMWDSLYRPLDISIVGTKVYVYPGTAIVDGKVYLLINTISFNCSSTGYYRLVLRKVFPGFSPLAGQPYGQTLQATLLYSQSKSSSDDYDSAPLATREDGTKWDVTLAMFVNDGTTLSFYPDNRSYSAYNTSTEYGNRAFPHYAMNVLRRSGGSATDWATAGTTGYAVPMARIEVGAFYVLANPQAVTFIEAFSGTPIVILSPWASGTAWSGNNICVSAISSAGFSIRADSIANLDCVQYFAVGPA